MFANNKTTNTIIAIFFSLVLAAANLAGLYYLDDSIGQNNVQVFKTALDINARSYTQWSYGIIPRLETVTADKAAEENMRIWAEPGDYSGSDVMGITYGLAAIMWFTWLTYLGFPGNMVFVRQRLLALLAALALTVITNLIFARMTTEFSDANPVLSGAFGYFSIGLSAGGIWFIAILSRLGIGRFESRPVFASSHVKDEKLSALMMSLVLAFVIENLCIKAGFTLPNISFGFIIWSITLIAFFNYYGYLPSRWFRGERPYGIMFTVFSTVITMVVWIAIQYWTDGKIGARLLTQSGSQGFSLMVSLWMLFWLTVSNHLGKTSPIRTR